MMQPETTEHHLKTWPGPFAATAEGRKTHEFRRDDRGFKVGDVLVHEEWDPEVTWEGLQRGYTGRKLRSKVTYLSRGPMWGIPEGYVVMSIRLEDGK